MNEREAIEKLEYLKGCGDSEAAHSLADKILLEFLKDNGAEDLARTFEEVREDVGFWYA
jgi:hypothetical protein